MFLYDSCIGFPDGEPVEVPDGEPVEVPDGEPGVFPSVSVLSIPS